MSEPDPVIQQNQYATQQEYWVCEFDDRKAAEVQSVDDVGADTEKRREEREFVDGEEEELEGYDDVDEAREGAFGDYAVFFDDFGEVVESAGDGEG